MSDHNGNGSNGAASPLMDKAMDQTTQVLQQGQQAATDLAGKALTQVKATIGTQKDNLAQTVDDVADALTIAGNKLRGTGGEAVAGYAASAAEQIKGVSQYLSDKNVDQIVQDTNEFARAKPAVFLSAALVLGIAAARFLKSSGKAVTPDSADMNQLVPVYSNVSSASGTALSDYSEHSENYPGVRPNYAVEPTVA